MVVLSEAVAPLGVGESFESPAAAGLVAPRLEGTGERAHDPGVGRDPFAARHGLDLNLQRLWEPEGDASAEVVAGCRRSLCLVADIVDDDEVRVAPCESHLDVPRR